MEQDQQTGTEPKTSLVKQINHSLHSGDYSRALDLLRGAAAEFPNDAELLELEKLAHAGVKRHAEANRLITQSQELFAQQNSAGAIQLLRQAYELDKNNSLARTILANALVEQAHSIVETDWVEAETLANQSLELNPAHPMAKTIRGLIVNQKTKSSVEDWVSRARKLQSSGDLFAALAWVAEGLAVHSDDAGLLAIQDAIQHEQGVRQRQARRRDLENLRRMAVEIDRATDSAAKQGLAERIQAVTAKNWTDGEILSVANGLLHRMGLVPRATPTPQSKVSAVIFHVPHAGAPKPLRTDTSQVLPSKFPANPVPGRKVLTGPVPASQVAPNIVSLSKVLRTPAELQTSPVPAPPSAPAAKVASPLPRPKQPERSNSTALILVSCAAIALVAATFFFTRKYYATQVSESPSATPTISAQAITAPGASASTVVVPPVAAPAVSTPAQATAEAPLPALGSSSSDAARGKATLDRPRPAYSAANVGTLLIVTGEDDARIALNGQLQAQLTQSGQLRLANLEPKDYVVQVSKSGFQEPAAQTIRIRKAEESKLVFNLQPQPRAASLIIHGGAPGTAVLVDQKLVGTIQPDGNLSVSSINAGDHTVELSKEGFKPRQFKQQFLADGAISLADADTALEAAPGELKITFAPADAKVAIVKDKFVTMVSSGAPLNLAAGTYTLSARTADSFTRWSTLEISAGQSKTLDLSLVPSGMSQWDDAGAWKREGPSFVRQGGDFVLYGMVPASGTFAFSAMLTKGRFLQWVLNYTDRENYVLFQMDNDNFYRAVVHNGKRTDEKKARDKGDKKSFRTLRIRVNPTELVHMVKHGDSWTVLDRWTQLGTDLSAGKFGFYLPGDDQITLSDFAHYADLNIR